MSETKISIQRSILKAGITFQTHLNCIKSQSNMNNKSIHATEAIKFISEKGHNNIRMIEKRKISLKSNAGI